MENKLELQAILTATEEQLRSRNAKDDARSALRLVQRLTKVVLNLVDERTAET